MNKNLKNHFLQYLISLEGHLYIHHGYKKVGIKQLLKKNEKNIQLWMAYAEIELIK